MRGAGFLGLHGQRACQLLGMGAQFADRRSLPVACAQHRTQVKKLPAVPTMAVHKGPVPTSAQAYSAAIGRGQAASEQTFQ